MRKHELCWAYFGDSLRGHISEAGSTALATLARRCEVHLRPGGDIKRWQTKVEKVIP